MYMFYTWKSWSRFTHDSQSCFRANHHGRVKPALGSNSIPSLLNPTGRGFAEIWSESESKVVAVATGSGCAQCGRIDWRLKRSSWWLWIAWHLPANPNEVGPLQMWYLKVVLPKTRPAKTVFLNEFLIWVYKEGKLVTLSFFGGMWRLYTKTMKFACLFDGWLTYLVKHIYSPKDLGLLRFLVKDKGISHCNNSVCCLESKLCPQNNLLLRGGKISSSTVRLSKIQSVHPPKLEIQKPNFVREVFWWRRIANKRLW